MQNPPISRTERIGQSPAPDGRYYYFSCEHNNAKRDENNHPKVLDQCESSVRRGTIFLFTNRLISIAKEYQGGGQQYTRPLIEGPVIVNESNSNFNPFSEDRE